jgi:exonuclease III
MGGTCIYVHNNLSAINIDLDKFCNDKDIEACAVSVNKANFEICIVAIYRSPSDNYDKFLDKLELILLKFSKKKTKVVICGDFNVNYMVNTQKKD